MPIFPPGDVTLLDTFTRADGAVEAGAGSTLWTADFLGVASNGLDVASNQLKAGASDGGGLTTESVADLIRGVTIVVPDTGYLALGYRIDGSDNGYQFSVEGGNWKFYRIDAGSYTQLASASGGSLTAGQRIAFRAVGGTHEAFSGTALYFDPTPIVDRKSVV